MSRNVRVEDALLTMFGLHGRPVTKLVVTCEVGKPPMLEVTQWVDGLPEATETFTYKIGDPVEVSHE